MRRDDDLLAHVIALRRGRQHRAATDATVFATLLLQQARQAVPDGVGRRSAPDPKQMKRATSITDMTDCNFGVQCNGKKFSVDHFLAAPLALHG